LKSELPYASTQISGLIVFAKVLVSEVSQFFIAVGTMTVIAPFLIVNDNKGLVKTGATVTY
jgi:hypothetical protein